MRLLTENKPTDLDRMVTVDLTVGELIYIYALFGSVGSSELDNALNEIAYALPKEVEGLRECANTYNDRSDFVYDGAIIALKELGVLK